MKTLLVALVLTASAHGALLFDKGTPQFPSYNASGFENADDFTFSSTHSILAVRFWTESVPTGPIYYRIYDNGASGAPGNLLGSGSATVNSTPFGGAVSGYILDFNLVSPVTLGVGTYYLSLHDGPYGTTDPNTLFWFSSGPGLHFLKANVIPGPPAEPQTSNEMAFQLFDTQFVPEPGTLGLVVTAAGLLLLRRRQTRS